LRKISVILLHDVEHCFRGALAMYSVSNLCMAARCSSVMTLLRRRRAVCISLQAGHSR
jgi:hypothetical protein